MQWVWGLGFRVEGLGRGQGGLGFQQLFNILKPVRFVVGLIHKKSNLFAAHDI